MLVFPQLATGAAALYPVTQQVTAADGGEYAGGREHGGVRGSGRGDAGVGAAGDGADAGEWTAIETLFQAASGRWQTFTFLDPAGNLLLQSEEFGAAAWTNGALIQLTPGIGDPLGTTRATQVVNAGSGGGRGGADAGGSGEFPILLERVGEDDGRDRT